MSDTRSSVLDLIDQVCDRYELAHLAGQRPRLDDYLGGVPEAERSGLLRELLRLEGAYLKADQRRRWQQGERVRLRAYLEEVPALRQHPELLFELVCAEVLLRLECHDTPPPRPVDYLELLPGQEAQLRRFFAARHLLPAATAQPLGERDTLRAARQDTVAAPHHTVDELPVWQGEPTMPPLPAPAAPPGYEVLGELGRGGMGVVCQARQVSAGRVVALKMLLHAGHADAEQLARFRSEAQAIARLQHPHVVQVFEVGEHGGLPFFSLEFCPGGSLDRKLAGTPLPPAEAAALVEKVARGVQAAHDAHVIHRDLKPANVLLAADGTPKVSDFGLARKLDAPGATHSGVIMGTPSYMAPEQARGQVERLGPAVDVYALGAVLYECLTGRPPFRAAAVMDTLLQVVSEEPVPPRQLNAKVPRDLETVCLKCLQKEASRRYASAAELAEDLGRFGRGEPVVARPVAVAERAAKWVRRNRWLAGALATVATTLLLGTALSIAFNIHAARSADQARIDEANAVAARNKLATTNVTLTQTADELEETLARSLLRPLALQGGAQPMTDDEWEALWQLATDNGGRLGYRFVKEAAQGPVTSRQLRDRAAPALVAAVGLDKGRRAEVEKLLLARLEEPAVGAEQKRDLALALAALGGLSNPAATRTAQELTRAWREETDAFVATLLAEALSEVAARQESSEAAKAADALALAVKRGDHRFANQEKAEAIWLLAARLEPKDAAQVAANLCQAIEHINDPLALPALRPGPRGQIENALPALLQGLSAVSARLESKDAVKAALSLVRFLGDGKSCIERPRRLTRGESEVTARLDADGVSAILSQALKKEDYSQEVDVLHNCLSEVMGRLESTEAVQVAGALTLTMKKVAADAAQQIANPERYNSLSPGQAPGALERLAKAFSLVAAHLGPTDAKPAAITLIQIIKDLDRAIKDSKDKSAASYHSAGALSALTQGLSAVAARMDPDDGEQVAATLRLAIEDATNANVLSALAAHLQSKDAAQAAAASFAQAMKDTERDNQEGQILSGLAQGLLAVVGRLEPAQARRVTEQAAARLVKAMTKELDADDVALQVSNGVKRSGMKRELIVELVRSYPGPSTWVGPDHLSLLARDLSALANHLDAREAGRRAGQAAAILGQAINDVKDPKDFPILVQGLSALARHFEYREVTRATTTLIQVIKDNKYPVQLSVLVQGLSVVSARLNSRDAAQAASTLIQAIKDNNLGGEMLAQALSAVAARLDPTDAAQAAAMLARAINNEQDPGALSALGQALGAVGGRLESKEAARVAAILIQAGHREAGRRKGMDAKDGVAAIQIQVGHREGLSAVAVSLDPRDAAQVAVSLTQTAKASRTDQLHELVYCLPTVAARLQAKHAAVTLAAAIKDTNHPYLNRYLAEGLSALLSAVPGSQVPALAATTASAVASTAGSGQPLAGLAPILAAAEPPPCRLSTQELIELLKMPTCGSEVGRVVLDQLGNRYRRSFADRWDFVRFAHERQLGLKFTSPPQPPGRAAAAP
jgi:hypothetical protein